MRRRLEAPPAPIAAHAAPLTSALFKKVGGDSGDGGDIVEIISEICIHPGTTGLVTVVTPPLGSIRFPIVERS